jgi:NAD(P)-dependent dehydrogenase (short-subunit alcohol dehydrogenase family)
VGTVLFAAFVLLAWGLGSLHLRQLFFTVVIVAAAPALIRVVRAAVNNVVRPGEITADDLKAAFRVNMAAPLLLAQELLPALTESRGLVVNISDHAAHEHWPAYAAHAASKAALESLTVSCARAWAGAGVRVNSIAPGLILPPDDWAPERVQAAAAAGELGTPEDVLALIVELAGAPTRSGELLAI